MARVAVDGTRCQGHGCCYGYFPELFVPDDDGYARVRAVGDAEPVEAAEAASVCPERAISVQDTRTGEAWVG